jgi:hypothetical protein
MVFHNIINKNLEVLKGVTLTLLHYLLSPSSQLFENSFPDQFYALTSVNFCNWFIGDMFESYYNA